MLFAGSSTSTKVGVKSDAGGPTLDTQASGEQGAVAQAAQAQGPVSRGYTEEIEHWAWCIRNRAPENQPRCHPEVALGDAVIAIGANTAVERTTRGEAGFVRYEQAWFDSNNDATPDGSSVEEEYQRLTKQA